MIARSLVCGVLWSGLTVTSGCDPDEPSAPTVCDEADEHSDLQWIQDNVFTPNCSSFDSCHRGGDLGAGGLGLEPGDSASNLIGVAARRHPDRQLVVPGRADDSYLMAVLGTEDVGPTEETMPPNGPLVCVEKRDAIRRWIDGLEPN